MIKSTKNAQENEFALQSSDREAVKSISDDSGECSSKVNIWRNHKLDFLRVLAILSCIVSHVLISQPGLSKIDYLWFVVYLPDTAAIFFMASGAILLERSSRCGWPYIWRRLMTFLPEFIIFSVLYVFLDKWYGYEWESISMTQQIFYMFVTPTWAPGWFILSLIGIYLIMPLMWAWTRTATKRDVEIALVLWLCATTLPAIMPHTPVDVPLSTFGTLFNCAGYALFGYYLHHWPLNRRSTLFKASYFVVTAFVGIVFGYFLARSGAKWGYMQDLISSLSINMVMVALFVYGLVLMIPSRLFNGKFGKAMTWLSFLSLGIYCSHWLVVRYWTMPNHIEWFIGLAVTLAVSIPIAWFMRFCRKRITRS